MLTIPLNIKDNSLYDNHIENNIDYYIENIEKGINMLHENATYSIFPISYPSTTDFPTLRFSDTFLSDIVDVFTLLLLPSKFLSHVTLIIFSEYYKNRRSNPKLIVISMAFVYLLNMLLVSYLAFILLNLSEIIYLIPIMIAAYFVFAVINSYKWKDIQKSKHQISADIDKRIEEQIKNEKNIERQRITVEALLTLKKFFSTLNIGSINYTYAMTSLLMVTRKFERALKNQNKKTYKSLEEETKQASRLLARSMVY